MNIVPPFVRSPYNYDAAAVSDETGTDCSLGGTLPSMCQQHFKEDSDINTIVKRFGLTGELPEGVSIPRYGDFMQVTDYHSAMNLVRAADEAFMEFPAEVRSRFQNDPGLFVDFCSDPRNIDELRDLGLATGGPSNSGAPGVAGSDSNGAAAPGSGAAGSAPPTAS